LSIKALKPHWRVIILTRLLAITGVASVLATLAVGSAIAQKIPPELPLAVFCWNEQTKSWVVGHLSTMKDDGTATYVGPNGRLSGTLNANGVVGSPANRAGALDCAGKTLNELRAMGRLIEVPRTR
jgi:hypothetical protein